jgi:hypothetical protein
MSHSHRRLALDLRVEVAALDAGAQRLTLGIEAPGWNLGGLTLAPAG